MLVIYSEWGSGITPSISIIRSLHFNGNKIYSTDNLNYEIAGISFQIYLHFQQKYFPTVIDQTMEF